VCVCVCVCISLSLSLALCISTYLSSVNLYHANAGHDTDFGGGVASGGGIEGGGEGGGGSKEEGGSAAAGEQDLELHHYLLPRQVCMYICIGKFLCLCSTGLFHDVIILL
jgi:hypothetical protein